MPFSPASSRISPNQVANSREAVYSFNWAETIVDRAFDSHPRVWEIVCEAFGFKKRWLVFLLACDAPEWPYIRSIVHQLEKWLAQQRRVNPEYFSTNSERKFLFEGLTRLAPKCPFPALKNYLTTKISSFTL